MRASSKQRDYHDYHWGKGEFVLTVAECAGITLLLAYFFYRSAVALLFLSPVGVGYFFMKRRDKIAKKREELALQFRECILSVATSLRAGYSVENAFMDSIGDMAAMFGDSAIICTELLGLKRGMNINISLEELLLDLAQRSGCEEIEQFAEIFSLAKRKGGNMTEMIRAAATRIGKRIELKQEVSMLLSGRKMELTVMKVMPFGILFYVNCGNPGYFEPLYGNLTGIVIMTVCLLVYMGAVWMGNVIMEKIVAELS